MSFAVARGEFLAVLRFANRFLLLKDRKVFAVGGMEVMTEENIAEVYGVKVRIRLIENRPVAMPL
ncbi:MAG: hypothetical protein ACYCV0_10940 [Desulfitobacteriaceae bacterium]